MAQFDFKSLSPDTIIDGLESAGFKVDSGLLPLNSYENRVYQFHDENLTKYVTKFYRPQVYSNIKVIISQYFHAAAAEYLKWII